MQAPPCSSGQPCNSRCAAELQTRSEAPPSPLRLSPKPLKVQCNAVSLNAWSHLPLMRLLLRCGVNTHKERTWPQAALQAGRQGRQGASSSAAHEAAAQALDADPGKMADCASQRELQVCVCCCVPECAEHVLLGECVCVRICVMCVCMCVMCLCVN